MANKSAQWTRRKLLRTVPVATASLLLSGKLGAIPTAAKTAQPPFSRFVDVAAKAGLKETMIYGDPSNVTYILESMGGGCAFFDYDNDGWMDIFIIGGRLLNSVPADASNRLYHNNRNGTFTDVTEKAGLLDAGWANGVCVGDYDNDGFEDLFLTYYGQNRLYHNNGDGTFTDVSAKAGLISPETRYGTGCTFVDYNRDGLLDLFVANYVQFDLKNAPRPSLQVPNCNYEGVAVYCSPKAYLAPSHYLYRNNGDGTFTDVSKESGVSAIHGSYGLNVVAFDADEDGWQDIFIACDSTPSLLLMNNRDGTFREEALLRGIALSGDGSELGSMGVGVGDYNLDGHLDVVKTHFLDQATGIYRNNGKGDFEDVTASVGLSNERRYISWGTGFVDFDNDGNPDIMIVAGTVYPELEKVYAKYPARDPRLIYRNRGDGTFQELGPEMGPAIISKHMSRGCAFGDFDNDGDMDVLIMNMNEPPSLLRNDAPAGNKWLKVRLEGTKSNRSAIGARVIVRYGKKIQAQTITSQSSYLSSNDPRLHFGLGKITRADIEIYWPSGAKEVHSSLTANQLVTIREGQGIVKGRPLAK
ncbi:MAG TPA: CRTAC1 family protein [Terriglobales bacterium]